MILKLLSLILSDMTDEQFEKILVEVSELAAAERDVASAIRDLDSRLIDISNRIDSLPTRMPSPAIIYEKP